MSLPGSLSRSATTPSATSMLAKFRSRSVPIAVASPWTCSTPLATSRSRVFSTSIQAIATIAAAMQAASSTMMNRAERARAAVTQLMTPVSWRPRQA
jgi:hypothetical protein